MRALRSSTAPAKEVPDSEAPLQHSRSEKFKPVGDQPERRKSAGGDRSRPSTGSVSGSVSSADWSPEERAAYIASLNLARLPAEASIHRFLEDALRSAKLPAPWHATRHDTGQLYFSNASTGVSTWHHPLTKVLEELAEVCRRVLAMPEETRAEWIGTKRNGWMAEANRELTKWYFVPHESGRQFYFHRETEATMWENPVEVVLPEYHLKIESLARLGDPEYAKKLLHEEVLMSTALMFPQAIAEGVPPGMDAVEELTRRLEAMHHGSSARPGGVDSSLMAHTHRPGNFADYSASRQAAFSQTTGFEHSRASIPQRDSLDDCFRQWDDVIGENGWRKAASSSSVQSSPEVAKPATKADILLVSSSRQGSPFLRNLQPQAAGAKEGGAQSLSSSPLRGSALLNDRPSLGSRAILDGMPTNFRTASCPRPLTPPEAAAATAAALVPPAPSGSRPTSSELPHLPFAARASPSREASKSRPSTNLPTSQQHSLPLDRPLGVRNRPPSPPGAPSPPRRPGAQGAPTDAIRSLPPMPLERTGFGNARARPPSPPSRFAVRVARQTLTELPHGRNVSRPASAASIEVLQQGQRPLSACSSSPSLRSGTLSIHAPLGDLRPCGVAGAQMVLAGAA